MTIAYGRYDYSAFPDWSFPDPTRAGDVAAPCPDQYRRSKAC